MKEIVYDTLIDGLKLLPFLFLTFLLIEFIEHKLNNKKIMTKSGKFGPLVGSLAGSFPQCGFSVSATNLYVTRIISFGTLISIYLSTSDEMIPILLSNGTNAMFILKIVAIKVFIGMFFGFMIDLFLNKKEKINKNNIENFCEKDHCDCKHGMIKSCLKHTTNVFVFIVLISFILNCIFSYLGNNFLYEIFMKNNTFGPIIASLVGLIPNCAASVTITELYLNNAITFGSMIGGLLTGSGVALIVLFKSNKNFKQNIAVLLTIYFIGVFCGIIINLIEDIL